MTWICIFKGDTMFLGHMTRIVNSKAQSTKTISPNRIEILWPSNLYGIRMLQNTLKPKHSGVNGVRATQERKCEPTISLSSLSGLLTTLPNSLPGSPVLFSFEGSCTFQVLVHPFPQWMLPESRTFALFAALSAAPSGQRFHKQKKCHQDCLSQFRLLWQNTTDGVA